MRPAFVVALLLSSACIGFKPNGKAHHLEFGDELVAGVANGLAQDVLLPQDVRATMYHARYDDGTVAAEGPGLQIIENVRLASGAFRLRVRCDPASTEVTRELHVTVSEGGRPVYEDRWDMYCLNGTAMSVSPAFNLPLVIGAEVLMRVGISATDADGRAVAATGHGFSIADLDPAVVVTDDAPDGSATIVELTALKAGSMPRLTAGALEQQLPLSVIDDSQWTLTAGVDRSVAGKLTATGDARSTAGEMVVGAVPCTFTLTLTGAQPQVVTSPVCGHAFTVDAAATGQVCVSTQRHQACTSF
jgi:hypothetical protein